MRFLIISKKTLSIIIVIMVLLIIASIFLTISNNTKKVFKEDIFYKGTSKEKIVAFMCNVDWGNEYIPKMLEIFEKNNIKISFFVTGRWAENNSELLSTINGYNHEIGNHGYSHVDYSKLSYKGNLDQISKADRIIKEIIGVTPRLFGPPSGAYNENTIQAAKDLEHKIIMWSIDTIDWRKDSTKDLIIERVITKAEGSSIVLMHPTSETINALPEIINYLFKNGYKIGTIGDVLD